MWHHRSVTQTAAPRTSDRPVRSVVEGAEPAPSAFTTAQIVVVAAIMMVLAQLAFRAWAVYGGWFYGDDFAFLSQAATEPLTLEYLFSRHDQQLMPGGLLISWLVGQGPAFAWPLAASVTLGMQACASAACLVMLLTLFGRRPAILAPLALYLLAPFTLGAFMWWAAALNQLPLQIAFFALIAVHVTYLRNRRWRWAALCFSIATVALLFYVKSVVMVPVVVLLTMAYFVDGGPVRRVFVALRRYWPVWVGYGVICGGYLVGYSLSGDSPLADRDVPYLETADRQIRQTLGPALLGGPWRWVDPGRPDVLADAPELAVTATWVVLAAIVVATCWIRPGAWRAWAILTIYLVPTVGLTASVRGRDVGPDIGLFIRYLTDVSVVACLALALATITLSGDDEPPRRRLDPATSMRWIPVATAIVFVAGSVWSTITYAGHWREDPPIQSWVQTARADLDGIDQIEVIDQAVDPDLVVVPSVSRPSQLLAPLGVDVIGVTSGNDLQAFGRDGHLQRAFVKPGIDAPLDRVSDCPKPVDGTRPVLIDLGARVLDGRFWMEVDYLASGDGDMSIATGGPARQYEVQAGPHSLMLQTSGGFSAVMIETDSASLTLCIDTITVGTLDTVS